MTITPVELHHIELSRGLLGYRRGPVDALIEEIERSFEATWRERAEYADRIEQLQARACPPPRPRDAAAHDPRLGGEVGARAQGPGEERGRVSSSRKRTRRRAPSPARRLSSASGSWPTRGKVRALLEAALDAVDDAEEAGDASDAQAA